MKNNKNGWGFKTFLIFLAIFCFCLLASFYGFRKLGLVDENGKFTKLDQIFKNEENNDEFSYYDLENDMIEATKKYINDFYGNELGIDTLIIKVSQLIDNEYLDQLKDEKNRVCSGYVSVYLENDSIKYKPYLKCKKYETKGYEERKDD